MTSCWAAYAISISRWVVMPLFMWVEHLSRDFSGNVVGRVDDGGAVGLGILLLERMSRIIFVKWHRH